MLRTRTPLVLFLVLPLAAVLSACGVSAPLPHTEGPGGLDETPSPRPTGPALPDPVPTTAPSASPTPTPSPTVEEPPVVAPLATSVVVDSRLVAAYDANGVQLAVVDYADADHAGAARRLAAALGLDPAVSTTGAIGTGCDADQTVYDFGGLQVRSPGYVASSGPIEVWVDGSTTTNGIPIVTTGGAQIGLERADFEETVGPIVDLGSYSGRNWVGFDRVNPAAPETEAVGTLARFDDGILAEWKAPLAFYVTC